MFLKQLVSCKFWATNDTPGSGSTVDLDAKELNSDSIYDLLKDDTDEAPIELDKKQVPIKEPVLEKGEEEEEEEEIKEIDELEELEKELEGPSEEQLELMTPVRRREILAAYPDLFKKFPYLEKAYYREQQFTEVFPTIDDARSAAEKAQTLDQYEQRILQGNIEDILQVTKSSDQNSFHRIVDNYMLALWNTDQPAYHHVIGNINKTLVASMVTEGRRQNNDQLLQAASIVQQYVFGNSEWSPPTRIARDTQSPERDSINQEKQQYFQERFEGAREDLTTRINNSLVATIEQNIDTKGAMTSYVKKAACDDAMKTLQRLISQDTRFQGLKDRLWQKAAEEGFSKTSVDRIKSAIASKAKTLLPTVIKKARIEALKGLGKSVRDDTEDREDGSTRTQKTRNTTSSSSGGKTYAERAKAIPKGMSSLDYLMKD
jgi:hypothetical protein